MVAEQREKLKMLINLLSAYYIRAGQVMKHNSLGTEWYGPVPDRVCKNVDVRSKGVERERKENGRYREKGEGNASKKEEMLRGRKRMKQQRIRNG
jgi:hypothetical protein